MTYLRIFTPCCLALGLLVGACTQTGADDDGETGETGDDTEPNLDCTAAGSELLPDLKPVLDPVLGGGGVAFTCGTGWGTDAPIHDADWSVQLGELSIDFFFAPVMLAAHPEGGVVVVTSGVLARYSAAGDELWSTDSGASFQSQAQLTIEADGDVVLGVYDWSQDDTFVRRYDADGQLVGDVPVPWNSTFPRIWGLETFGSDLVIGASDTDEQGSYEDTLMRLDAMDNVVLRKSTSQSGGNLLAVNADGTAMFGLFPGYLVSLDNGAVLGTWAPSTGNAADAVGYGSDFVIGANGNNDLGVGRYSGLGSERWLQTYDRAALNDQARAVAVGEDGTIAVSGSTGVLNFDNAYWYASQPQLVVADADGNALWIDRIAAHGEASSVAIGSAGEVYLAGTAELDGAPGNEPGLVTWLRGYSAG